jgi:sterol 3beta-glucosyltransferase
MSVSCADRPQADVPHEWLFSDGRVAGVVHHGGAGTTATGLRYGRPTAIIPFFGDQKFWGDAVYGAGAGPSPIPFKLLELEAVTNAIQTLCDPAVIAAAEGLGQRIRSEKGEARGADSFHHHLPLYDMR